MNTEEKFHFIRAQLIHLSDSATIEEWKKWAKPQTHHYLIEYTGAYSDTFITLSYSPLITLSTKHSYIRDDNTRHPFTDHLDLNDYYETCYIATR